MARPDAARLSGRISLRVPAQVHSQLAEVAAHLGLDLTELLNLMIAEHLPQYAKEAAVTAQSRDAAQTVRERIHQANALHK